MAEDRFLPVSSSCASVYPLPLSLSWYTVQSEDTEAVNAQRIVGKVTTNDHYRTKTAIDFNCVS